VSIQPQRHDIDAIFGSRRYHIDFYQRDYRWQQEHVDSLLDDVFYKFDSEYSPEIESYSRKLLMEGSERILRGFVSSYSFP